jgi:rubrerythrin
MGPVEALNIALQKEIEARDSYRKFSEEFPAIKDLCFFLLNEEEKHKKLIESRIAELQNK